MKSVVIVLALVLMAAAAGMSFVFQSAGAQENGATLEAECSPPLGRGVAAVEAGVYEFVSCRFEARNTGDSPLPGASLSLMPAPDLSPPREYRMFHLVRDGVREAVSPGQLTFTFADMAPGEQSTIELGIILKSDRPFGARADLIAETDRYEPIASASLRGDVTNERQQRVAVTLEPGGDLTESESGRAARYELVVSNELEAEVEDVVVEIDARAGSSDDVEFAAEGEWEPIAGTGHLSTSLGTIASGETLRRELTFTIPEGGCAYYLRPALVLTARRGETGLRTALLPETVTIPATEACPPGIGGGGEAALLPATGTGPGESDRSSLALPILVAGMLSLLMGITTRRSL